MTREPVALSIAVGGLLASVVAVLALLLPDALSPALQAAIIVLGNAIILTVSTLYARSQVTPVAAPALALGTPVLVLGTADTPPADAVVALKA